MQQAPLVKSCSECIYRGMDVKQVLHLHPSLAVQSPFSLQPTLVAIISLLSLKPCCFLMTTIPLPITPHITPTPTILKDTCLLSFTCVMSCGEPCMLPFSYTCSFPSFIRVGTFATSMPFPNNSVMMEWRIVAVPFGVSVVPLHKWLVILPIMTRIRPNAAVRRDCRRQFLPLFKIVSLCIM